jgi:ubiquinol-cytochrome c reductase cytochrome b/c1 subunit
MAAFPSTVRSKNKLVLWIDRRLPLFSFTQDQLMDYPEPKNLSYWWSFGSLAGILLVIMIASGVFLAMQYTPNADLAFNSVERIMRDVNYGWLVRYIHMNGASFFFIIVYIHLFRGMYYGSYKEPRELLWMLGVLILLLMMATAFFGYVLPWGQMSFWGATVITNLFSVIPVVGKTVLTWLLGGYAIGNPTLNRFFSLHYLLPFIIVGVVMLHLIALRQHGSNNPLGIDVKGPQDEIPFHPYYTIKDMFGLGVFLIIYALFVFYAPNLLGDAANYIPANPLQTPPEIVPEWYLLPFYAILRSVPDILFIPSKLAGAVCLFGSIFILFLLPWLDTSRVRSAYFRPIYKWLFWVIVVDVLALGIVGAHRPEGWYIVIGRIATLYYFVHFLILLPLVGWFERPLPLPESIAAAVTRKSGGVPVTQPGAAS